MGGVVKEDGSAITSTDVKDTTVAKEVGVKAEDLPENVQNIVEEEKRGGYTAVTETLKTAKKRGGGNSVNSPSPGAGGLTEDDVLSSGNSVYIPTPLFCMVFMAIVAL